LPGVEIPGPSIETQLDRLVGQGALELPESDDIGGTSVDAESAPGALVLINDEEPEILRVIPRMVDVDAFIDRIEREVVDALPRANVDASLANDALRLIDVEKLLGTKFVREVIAIHNGELIIVPDRWGLIHNSARHQVSPLTSGRP
jgi:hypothetical protein